jgi:hypothetical protein
MKTNKGKSKKSGKKSKKDKPKKEKKEKKTSGFPEMVALTKEKDGDTTYYSVHPADFADINEDTLVGIFRFRRAVNVTVSRKIKRTPKE